MEAYTPNSEAAQKYQEKRLQVYVYRHFRTMIQRNEPTVVRIQDLNSKFTKQSETLIRKKIKHCAEFQRIGDFAGQWALKVRHRGPEALRMACERSMPFHAASADERSSTNFTGGL
jgi:hypothetical protein